MPTFNTPLLTDAGRDLLGRINAGKTSVSYTKTVFSSMDNSDKTDDNIKQMKDITPAEITTQPSTNYEDGNTVEIRGIGNNKGIHNAVAINTYATYAKDSDSNEFPFAIAVSQTPDYMPADSGQAITNLTFSILFTVQDTKNIKFNDPHNEAPTYQDIVNVNNRVDGIQGTIDDTLKLYNKRISDNSNSIKKLQLDTDSSIKTALNQANGHSDNHYNDLSNKNNILSQKMEDYQKPNIAPVTEVDNWHAWWNYPYSFNVEQGKTYILSAYFNNVTSGYGYFYSFDANGGNLNAAAWNGGWNNWIQQGQSGLYIAKYNADHTGAINFGFGYNAVDKVSNICITQSNSYVPYEIAQQNKQAIESASQTDLDNAKSDLQNKTNDLSSRISKIENKLGIN